MRKFVPWLRTAIAIVLGIVAIAVVHLVGSRLIPAAYAPPGAGPLVGVFIALIMLAGIAGAFVTVLVARHRPWLHMAIFLLIMLVMDIAAALGEFAGHDLWFNAFMLLSLPLQAWLGTSLALRVWPQPSRQRA